MLVSARSGEGLAELDAALAELPHPAVEVRVQLPYDRGDLVGRVHREGQVLYSRQPEEGTELRVRVGEQLAADLESRRSVWRPCSTGKIVRYRPRRSRLVRVDPHETPVGDAACDTDRMRRLVFPVILASGLVMLGACRASADDPTPAATAAKLRPARRCARSPTRPCRSSPGLVATKNGFIAVNDGSELSSQRKSSS